MIDPEIGLEILSIQLEILDVEVAEIYNEID